ncbi:acetylcholine receptor subunit alpha-L1 [Patella vulgata]|uniref:acetylcholine receptor subunit alpha-L1 n=1 Tax=Patella vulgata TaxID=6465 RepID=UPI00217FDC91|nr:acetylcholine receptor subunit alpha-L1 [Patella vulgata]
MCRFLESFITALFIVLVLKQVFAANIDDVSRLHADLFRKYRRVIPPVYNQSKAVNVKISMFLLMIHDLDMRNQVLTTSGWLNMQWHDEFLRWNKSDYGGVADITVSQNEVWLPDLLVENTALNFAALGNSAMLISIDHNGRIYWEPGIMTKTICEVNIGKYPFDYQACEIKFLTWMHTNKTLGIFPGSEYISLDACIPNGEWDITSATSGAYSYPSTYRPGYAHTGVTFKIELMRKRTFYVLNTIVPVVLLSFLNVLVFLLPASSGEKMALAVTVLLSFTVYLSIVSEVMPKTSESISILAVYLTLLLTLSTMSVLSSGVVMNMIHQDANKPIPPMLKCVLCCRKKYRNRNKRIKSLKRREYERNGDCSKRIPDADLKHFSENSSTTKVEIKASGENGRTELSPLFETTLEEDDFTWEEIGGAVDNLLFWVFLFITIGATSTVLAMFSW